jgi:O-antigen ligase
MRWGIIDTPIGGIYKLASIFWEPGQFQIVLIYILCLFIDDILKHISSFKYLISNYSLFVVCLLLTGSTTAYLTLGFLLTGILVVGVRVKRSYKILLIILGMLISVGLFNSSIVQDKFAQKDSAEDNSYNTRLLDNLAALNITLENPIFGAGVCSQKKLNYYLKTDREESSNGWLSTSASFGIPFLLIMLYLMFSNLRVIYGNKIAIVVFITLVFSQAAEAVIYFPYMWLYIFKWKRISDKRTYRKFRIIIRRRELDNLIID